MAVSGQKPIFGNEPGKGGYELACFVVMRASAESSGNEDARLVGNAKSHVSVGVCAGLVSKKLDKPNPVA
jgi:hypothetical protein